MKNIIVITVMAFSFNAMAQAVGAPPPPSIVKNVDVTASKQVEGIASNLNLNDTQKTQLSSVLTKFAKARKTIASSKMSANAQTEALTQNAQEERKAIKKILNREQYVTFMQSKS